MPDHAEEHTSLIFDHKFSQNSRKPSQLSHSNLKNPATGFTRNRNSDCQLFLINSVTDEKTDCIPCQIFTKKSLIPCHKLIQNSRKPSHLFQSVTKMAISATTAAITSPMGLAANTALSAAKAVLTAPNAEATLGTMVRIVPIALMTFPITMSTGPKAATNNPIFKIISRVPSSMLFNLSTNPCIHVTTSRMTGISISPKEMASSSSWLFSMVS